MRIRMPKGHTQLSLAGHLYTPDATGAFEVPDQFVPELMRSHGAVEEISIAQFEQNVEDADAAVNATRALLEQRTVEAKVAREALERAKAKAKADTEARAKAEAEFERTRAETEARTKTAAAVNNGPVRKTA